MTYELKNATATGGVVSNDTPVGTMTQKVNITIGVVGCPHLDIKSEKTVDYVFSETLTALQIKEGIPTFASAWVAENYPTTE